MNGEFFSLTNRVVRSTIAVVDTISSRGGFRGEELSTIGHLRDNAVQLIQLIEQAEGGSAEVAAEEPAAEEEAAAEE